MVLGIEGVPFAKSSTQHRSKWTQDNHALIEKLQEERRRLRYQVEEPFARKWVESFTNI